MFLDLQNFPIIIIILNICIYNFYVRTYVKCDLAGYVC